MPAFREELFGPPAAVARADDPDHALRLANDTAYGLSPAILTNDLQLAMKFVMELEAGMVHINGPTVHDVATVSFGSVKDSGSGREGGHWSMDELDGSEVDHHTVGAENVSLLKPGWPME